MHLELFFTHHHLSSSHSSASPERTWTDHWNVSEPPIIHGARTSAGKRQASVEDHLWTHKDEVKIWPRHVRGRNAGNWMQLDAVDVCVLSPQMVWRCLQGYEEVPSKWMPITGIQPRARTTHQEQGSSMQWGWTRSHGGEKQGIGAT